MGWNYEIIEIEPTWTEPTERKFTVVDPHPTHPIVLATCSTREDAEMTLEQFKRDDAIANAFETWMWEMSDEHRVDRSYIADIIDVDSFR